MPLPSRRVTPELDPMLPTPYRILRRKQETRDTFTLEIAPADGSAHPGFQPGQFNMLYQFGAGEVPISFSGADHDPSRMIHTIRAVGPVTVALSKLKVGATIGVRGPFGTPWPLQNALGKDVVVVVGGIGLAPLRPVIYHILHRRAQFGRLVILYGGRTPNELLFMKELHAWETLKDVQVEVTVDRADAGWTGLVGVVPSLLPSANFDPYHAIAMTCGPEIMMKFAARGLMAKGVNPDNIYLSMERNMKCAIGQCGRCQLGPTFICKNGPVYPHTQLAPLLEIKEL